MVDQGLAFSAIIRSSDGVDGGFDQAVKVWLGAARGTDWLHSAIENELGEDYARYEVRSSRSSIHVGASGEVLEVALTLLGAGAVGLGLKVFGKAADRAVDSVLDAAVTWAKLKVARHRVAEGLELADGPPNLVRDREPRSLARVLREDLASLLSVDVKTVTLNSATREGERITAVYCVDGGETYYVEVSGNRATFTRRGAADPVVPATTQRRGRRASSLMGLRRKSQ